MQHWISRPRRTRAGRFLGLGLPGIGLLLVILTCGVYAEGGDREAEATIRVVIERTKVPELRDEELAPWVSPEPWIGSGGFVLSFPGTPVDQAIAEALAIEGPEGTLIDPGGRLWIRTETEEALFAELTTAVPLTAPEEASAEGLPVELQFRPQWSDPAGHYRMLVAVRPLTPLADGTAARAAQLVELEAEVPPLISASLSQGDLRFVVEDQPGIYRAEQNVHLTLSTNAAHWRVQCEAAPVSGAGRKIPPGQIEWERVAIEGWPAVQGRLGEGAVILSGDHPVANLEVELRFRLHADDAAAAGEYRGQISVIGMVGP